MTDSANRSSAHGPSVNSRRPDPRITWANCKLSVRATQDGGQTWQAVAQLDADPWVVDITRSVFALTFATLNDGWAYRPGGGGALWATHDGGVSWSDETGSDWSVVDLQASGGAAWRLDVSGSCRSIETDCNWRTARTDDGGLTWQLVAAQPAVQSTPRTARLAVRSATEAWVASQGELLVTRDGGASWQARTTPCGAAAVEWPAAFAPALDGQALWMICSGQPGAGQQLKRAYVSTDDGQSWTEPGPPSWAGYVGPLVALSADRALWVWRVAAGWCWGRATAVRAGRSSCARRTIATVW